MAQDLRSLFKREREKEKYPMKKGHQSRFLERLDAELPIVQKRKFYYLKIAASVILIISIGLLTYEKYSSKTTNNVPAVVNIEPNSEEVKGISLGDLSPDLRKVEAYYVANINLELSELEISNDNEALIDSYIGQLGMLNNEYQKLNKELNTIGPNDQTIAALIKNLQLRLQLLQKLKKKLNDLKSSKNEQIERTIS